MKFFEGFTGEFSGDFSGDVLGDFEHGRRKVHECMLVIWAAQPGPNG